ncbi:MAG: DUF2807 domain-containing protein [Paludibacteraceae bacterium]|nr:DUF2807 domain-containing protein [Paludibacteraceae bacterium]
MKRILTLLAVCVMLCACSSDWGALETVNYPINGSYTSLVIGDAFQVTVSESATEAMVTIGEKARQYVRVEVTDGTLYLSLTGWNFSSMGYANVVIPANADLNCVKISGASSYKGNMSAEEVKVIVSGASQYEGTITADEAEMAISGAGKVVVDGSCDHMDISVSGASKLDAAAFPCVEIEGQISGASNVDVTCCERLAVNVSGASTLTYGTPSSECNPQVECESTGGSTIKKR